MLLLLLLLRARRLGQARSLLRASRLSQLKPFPPWVINPRLPLVGICDDLIMRRKSTLESYLNDVGIAYSFLSLLRRSLII